MALRGEDQFYMTISSDGSLDVNPDNKTSEFKVSLKQAIETGNENWEVALISINYPYSWTNLGPAAKTFVKYYVDPKLGPQEINFPDWLCNSMEEIIEYMASEIWRQESKEIREKLEDNRQSRIQMKLDELKRFKMASVVPYFDVGFSDNMMQLLGLHGHPMAANMTVKAFNRRQKHRDFLDEVWDEDKLLDYRSSTLRQPLRNVRDLEDFAATIFPYVDMNKLVGVISKEEKEREENFPYFERLTSGTKEIEENLDEGIDDDDVLIDPDWVQIKYWIGQMRREERQVGNFDTRMKNQQKKGMARVLYHLTKLLNEKDLPKIIKATIPGQLNPIQRMFIYTNIIEPVDVNDTAVRLLKMVNTGGSPFATTHEEFLRPTYLPLLRGKISMIYVYIADQFRNRVPFQVGTVIITLHFQKVKKNILLG